MKMKKLKSIKFVAALLAIFLLGTAGNSAFAQLKEPEVVELPDPKTPLSEGYHNSLGVDVILNNFGFGLGGHYSRVLGPFTELTFQTGITGIRDVSEQNYQNIFTGQQIVPNKYKRALGFPFLLGLKHRLFARQIDDNFRFFVSGAMGPAMTFIYPYVQDTDGNGFRTFRVLDGFLVPTERINDFFSGWKNGETKWGYNGELKIGVDFGSSFKTRTTVEFGYFFYYFKQGLQIMEPRKPIYDNQGRIQDTEPFFDAQKYFGTPQIKITFGGMW